MDIISSILDGLDNVGNLVPELEKLLSSAQLWVSICLLVGPICMLVLGLVYLFLPPKEANHHIGYRTYFGMGSVEAWLHTQKIAGILYGGLGLVLGIVMFFIGRSLGGKDTMEMAMTAIKCLCVQLGIVLLIYLGMFVYTAIVFDRHGNRRFARRKERIEA